jgi:hypothetical protein
LVFFTVINIYEWKTDAQNTTTKIQFISNLPYGEGKGVFPGRVIWAWNPDATDENCTNKMDDPVRGEDGYFLAKNNDQDVIDSMLNNAILKLSGKSTIKSAWEVIFNDFNKRKGRSVLSYQPGQTIFVKINQGGGGWLTNSSDLSFIDASWAEQYYGIAETSPAVVISLLKQLVNDFGIDQSDIYIGDPIAHIYKHNYDQLVAVFPNVHYVDKSHSDLGRTLLTPSELPCIFYSDKGTVMPDAISDKLYKEMENADYQINIAALKAHARAGVTLTAKNHFGSHTRSSAEKLHPGLIAPENDQPVRTDYGMYRVLTDIMGHEKLGGNTVLFLVDGLWGGPEAVEQPVKWHSAPFNNDWPNSVFISQDQVALESVCLDFLRAEFFDPDGPGKARPYFDAVNDYLLQAADSGFWPEGIIYDPENDGKPIGSLGVCEHWNNDIEKLYSRNLGFNKGIELISTKEGLVKTGVASMKTDIVPVIDGDGNDSCWLSAELYQINYPWIEWGIPVDSSDFYGTYKICWSEKTNLLYFYIEIVDDAFIDGYHYPDSNYPDYDVVEIFIDEDKSGGLHVFDDNPAWGMNSENAFSYHIVLNSPEDGSTESDFTVCDIDGTDWSSKKIMNYKSHFPELIMKKEGNKYKWEFSMKVYNDTYDDDTPEDSRVILNENKVMGLSIAYCDNDQPDGKRDNFFGSVWVPQERYNDHWKNADDFGLLRLIGKETSLNHKIILIDTIPDITISYGENIVIVSKLGDYFVDPDNDKIIYNVTSNNPLLSFEILNEELRVSTSGSGNIDALATVLASDGEFTTTDTFNIFGDATGMFYVSPSTVDLNIYPNPFSDYINIRLSDEGYVGIVSVMVYDLQGNKILTGNFYKQDNDLYERLKTIDIPDGTYIIKIQYSDKQKSVLIRKGRE